MRLEEAEWQRIVTVGNKRKGVRGDYLDYKPEHKKCVLTKGQTGCKEDQTFETEQLGWRIERFNNQLFLVADDATDAKLTLRGQLGYKNGIKAMDQMCKDLYSNSMLGCRAMNITKEMFESFSSIISNKRYWLGLSYAFNYYEDGFFGMYYADDGSIDFYILYNSFDGGFSNSFGVRPIVPLKSDIQVEILDCCDGSKEKPWHIVVPS